MFDVIQSVDSIKLAEKINSIAEDKGIKQDVMIQVNISKEKQKYGISPELTIELFEKLEVLKNLNVIGLMCMAPNIELERRRPYFRRMKTLFDTIRSKYKETNSNINLSYLSMGMSSDYTIAMDEGSNMLRIGRALVLE